MQYLGNHEQDLTAMPPLAKRWKENMLSTLFYTVNTFFLDFLLKLAKAESQRRN